MRYKIVARPRVLLGKPHYVGGVDQEHPGLNSHLVTSCKTIRGTADLKLVKCAKYASCVVALWNVHILWGICELYDSAGKYGIPQAPAIPQAPLGKQMVLTN